MFEKSILVVAHLDDETLWFSSIVNQVDEIAVCFLTYALKPEYEIGRRKSMGEYPYKNLHCFELDESGAFELADWNNPTLNEYGIELLKPKINEKYKNNYDKLYESLKKKLFGFKNVYTHNPWGEYGHEEHVQVYRVVSELQKIFGFNIIFSNYCSNKSCALMLKYLYQRNFEFETRRTNKELGIIVKKILMKNSCWTWYEDWEWPDTESMIKEKNVEAGIEYGRLFPFNFITVERKMMVKKKISKRQYVKSLLCKICQ